MSEFISRVKSTIDKAGVGIAQNYGQGVEFVDLNDMVNTQKMLATEAPAIVWEMLTLYDRDPLYTLQFGIGAKTTADPGNYGLTDLLDAVHTEINKGDSLDIRDWTPGGDNGALKHGYMFFTDVSVDPQLYDKQSGIRLISVTAQAVRNV